MLKNAPISTGCSRVGCLLSSNCFQLNDSSRLLFPLLVRGKGNGRGKSGFAVTTKSNGWNQAELKSA